MRLLKMYKENFGEWLPTTFEREKNLIKDHYEDVEMVRKALKRGDVVGLTFSMLKVPKNEIVKERR